MFKSIYKKLKEDFNFVENYQGYRFKYDLKHYQCPSIEFDNHKTRIQIGFNYDDNRFFIYIYDLTRKDTYHNVIEVLKENTLIGKSYKEQYEQVKKILIEYLQKT